MLGSLAQPKVQSADDAVLTLCDRLSNSLLLEDRKAAVLTLRGLSHENRELVASVGLKGLLNTLVKDSFDPSAAKATLETLLILFNTDTRRRVRNRRFISPSLKRDAEVHTDDSAQVANDISSWLTDQLSHNEEALQRVLELATTKNDPFTAVYALQSISVMTVNRPLETKQTLSASGGMAQSVAALGSAQEMVRDEALLLVSALTTDHLELQKLVAFEGGLDYALRILIESGGAVFGGRFAEDSLTLVANSIEFNTSNQKLFVQSGNLGQWTQILQSIVDAQNDDATSVRVFYKDQVIANIHAALLIGQLLCLPDAELTKSNQDSLKECGAFTLILQIASGATSPPSIRVSALSTAAALISNNEALQNDFLETDVPYYDLARTAPNGGESKEIPIIPIAQASLNWCISLNSTHSFDLRAAAMICLRNAMSNNLEAKLAFVNEQIEQYQQHNSEHSQTETEASTDNEQLEKSGDSQVSKFPNLISVLAEYSEETRLNPLRIWFAASVVMHLFDNTPEVKEKLRTVTVGDASLGMEVQSSVQALAGELQGALQIAESSSQIMREPTVVLGYLQSLTVWLYDDFPAVNDFLEETTIVRSLLAQYQTANPLVSTISVVSSGVAYAFCTDSSPLSRMKFYELLTQALGRDQYLLSIRKFKQSPTFYNFDESEMFGTSKSSSEHTGVYLDSTFISLMREGLTHISRVIDMDPRVEPSTKITFEMIDEAKQALFKKTEALEETEAKLKEVMKTKESLEKELDETQQKARESNDSTNAHLEKSSKTETDLHEVRTTATSLESQLETAKSELNKQKANSEKSRTDHKKLNADYATVKAAKEKAETGINNMTRELFQSQRQKETLEKEQAKTQSESSKLKPKLETASGSETKLKNQLKELSTKHTSETQSLSKLKETNEKLVAKSKETASFLTEREEEEEELKSELSAIKIKAESQENEYRSLKNREAMGRKQLDSVKAEHETVSALLKTTKDELDSARKQIEQLKSDISNKNAESNSEETQSLRNTVTTSRAENEKLSKSIDEIKANNKDLTSDKNHLDKEVTELRTKIDTLSKEVSDVNSKLADLRKEKENLMETNSVLKKEMADLQNNLAKQQSKVSEAEAKVEKLKASSEENDAEKKPNGSTSSDADNEQLQKNNEQSKQVNQKLTKELAGSKDAQKTNEQNATKAGTESKERIAALEAKLQERQNDLDESMVLLEDLSEKKDSYKKRLRNIEGQTVSDSDEEDSEEDN